jgi:hypothetical protein
MAMQEVSRSAINIRLRSIGEVAQSSVGNSADLIAAPAHTAIASPRTPEAVLRTNESIKIDFTSLVVVAPSAILIAKSALRRIVLARRKFALFTMHRIRIATDTPSRRRDTLIAGGSDP